MKIYLLFFFIISISLLNSCATTGVKIRASEEKETVGLTDSIDRRFYIIGSTSKEKSIPILTSIENEIISDSTENKHLIFIGDNVNEKSKENVYEDLDREISVVEKADIDSYFVPGNYDWGYNKTEGLETIEDYLEEKLKREDLLVPNNGCPLESIEIGDDVQLLVIDSQWFILDWDLFPEMNGKCEIKTREKLFMEIEGEFKKNANKTIVLAVHHPLYTNGYHGGRFSLRDHIFPLQGNIPAPVIASLIVQIRAQGAVSIQDRFNKRYREFADKLTQMIDAEDDHRIIVVSGHDLSQQYIEQNNVKQIISSAAEDTRPAALSNNGLFSSGGNGFATLDILKDKSVWTTFYGVDKTGNTSVLYKKNIFKPLVEPNLDSLPTNFPKTFSSSVYELDKVEKSDFFKSFWGNHYREVYGTKVSAPTALLDTLYGGLTVIRPGGGHQTKSLRLETKDGKEYNMRALKKSAVQFLETTAFKGTNGDKYFSKTVPEDLILDFYTAAHPYGAFAVPKIAKAAGVYYTTPQLFYVPQQKALGKYNEEYGNQLFMIVEKPSDEYTDRKSFGYPDDVESTEDLLKKLREDEDYTLDEEAYIRARIFDMLLGDWDRHSDQWRWAEFEKEEGKKVFVPIPRDRDQVFANFDGSFLNLLRSIAGGINQFGVYGEDIKDVRWFNEAGVKLDRALVKRSGKNVWMEQAAFLQKAIDNQTVEEAFASLPIEVQDSTLSEIKENFLKRKSNLQDIVERYYYSFIGFQMLTGTDKDDLFEITRSPGKTQIKAFRIKDGEKGDLLFDREFINGETKEVWLYGLDDKDVFKATGEAKDAILIRIIGGNDNDKYDITEGKELKIYDQRTSENTIENRGGAHFRFTDFYETNLYNYKKIKSQSSQISFKVGFNPDDGTTLNAGYSKSVNRFIENPYGSKTELFVGYQFLTQGLDIHFNKGYAAVFKDFNFILETRYTSKNYTENFFGFGNETKNLQDTFSLDYNRVNLEKYNGGIGLEKSTVYGSFFQIKYDLETTEVFRNGTNILSNLDASIFGERYYYGIPNATYQYKNTDDIDFPSKGMNFSAKGGVYDDLNSSELTGFANSELTFYNPLTKNGRFILKTGVKGGVTVGDSPIFFLSPTLGGDTGLRSYRNQRFTGESTFAGNADLVYNFQKFKTFFFPIDLSIYGGYDMGRVWIENESSKQWHNSYGGGFLVKWTDAIKGNFSTFYGEDGARIVFGFKLSN